MRIAIYPFASGSSVAENIKKIEIGVNKASIENVDLIVFHECALCGYPPLETTMDDISKDEINEALVHIAYLAKNYHIFIAIGTIRFQNHKAYNAIIVYDDEGKCMGFYDKKALWGWDKENFSPGSELGVFLIKGVRIGFRICFDIRFPELFRELFQKVDLCVVNFSDTSKENNLLRYQLIKSHIITRAVENAMPIITVNSLTNHMTAPNCMIAPNGCVIEEDKIMQERLIVYTYASSEPSFGIKGIIENAKTFSSR